MHKSLKDERDNYGSAYREHLMRSMESPVKKARKVYYHAKDSDSYDLVSWVVGIFCVLFLMGAVIAQIVRHWIP